MLDSAASKLNDGYSQVLYNTCYYLFLAPCNSNGKKERIVCNAWTAEAADETLWVYNEPDLNMDSERGATESLS